MSETRWIPISERLPDYGVAVLTLTLGLPSVPADPPCHVRVAWRREDGYWVDDKRVYYPTHWHPLPAHPCESEPELAPPPPTAEKLGKAAMTLFYDMQRQNPPLRDVGERVRHLWAMLKHC